MNDPGRHLTEPEARQLLSKELPVKAALRAGGHIHHCTRCWELAERVDPEGFAAFVRAYGLTQSERPGRDPGAHLGWMAEATRAHSQMETLHRKLRPLPPERRRLLLGNLDSTPLYCKLVTIRRVCKELFLTSPNEALDLASFGLELLAENREVLESEARVSFEASLLAHYGNGLRIIGELREAEKCLRKAEKLSLAAGDPLDQAWTCRYLGYVLADSRKYEEALRFARAAKKTFEAVHESKLVLETQAIEAKFLYEAGRYVESVGRLKALEEHVINAGQPDLELSVKEYLLVNYLQMGSQFLTRPLLPRIRVLAEGLGGVARIKARWLEALSLEGVGDLASADKFLERVCSEFRSDYPYDHALAALDRIRVLVRQGSVGQATALLRDLIPLAKGARLHSQAVRALRLLAEQRLDTPLLRAVQDFLSKVQRDPSYTLEEANLPC